MSNKTSKLKLRFEAHFGHPVDVAVPAEVGTKNPGNRMLSGPLAPILGLVVANNVGSTLLISVLVAGAVTAAGVAVWHFAQPRPVGLCRTGDELAVVELDRRGRVRSTLRRLPVTSTWEVDRNVRPPFRRVVLGNEVFWAHMAFDRELTAITRRPEGS